MKKVNKQACKIVADVFEDYFFDENSHNIVFGDNANKNVSYYESLIVAEIYEKLIERFSKTDFNEFRTTTLPKVFRV